MSHNNEKNKQHSQGPNHEIFKQGNNATSSYLQSLFPITRITAARHYFQSGNAKCERFKCTLGVLSALRLTRALEETAGALLEPSHFLQNNH